MKNEALQHFRALMPYMAGRLTLAQFTLLAVATLDVEADLPRLPGDLVHVLQEEGGNVSAAARRLGVATKTIYRRLAKSGMDIVEIRARSPL